MKLLKARFRRWCHCVSHVFRGDHRAITYLRSRKVLVLACTCDRIFYDDSEVTR